MCVCVCNREAEVVGVAKERKCKMCLCVCNREVEVVVWLMAGERNCKMCVTGRVKSWVCQKRGSVRCVCV